MQPPKIFTEQPYTAVPCVNCRCIILVTNLLEYDAIQWHKDHAVENII